MGASRPRRVLFRVDASKSIGTGHLVRCVALSTELAGRGMEIGFAARPAAIPPLDHMEAKRHSVIPVDGQATEELAEISRVVGREGRSRPFEALVVDHYGLGADWLTGARRLARRRIVIDDLADRPLPSEVLVNPSLGVTPHDYAGLVRSGDSFAARASIRPLATCISVASPRTAAPSRDRRPRDDGGQRSDRCDPGGGRRCASRIADGSDRGRPRSPLCRRAPLEARHPRAPGDRRPGHGSADADRRHRGGRWWHDFVGAMCPRSADRDRPGCPESGRKHGAVGPRRRGDRRWAIGTGRRHRALATLIRRLAEDAPARQAMSDRARDLVDGRGVERLANHIDGVRVRRAYDGGRSTCCCGGERPGHACRVSGAGSDPLAAHMKLAAGCRLATARAAPDRRERRRTSSARSGLTVTRRGRGLDLRRYRASRNGRPAAPVERAVQRSRSRVCRGPPDGPGQGRQCRLAPTLRGGRVPLSAIARACSCTMPSHRLTRRQRLTCCRTMTHVTACLRDCRGRQQLADGHAGSRPADGPRPRRRRFRGRSRRRQVPDVSGGLHVRGRRWIHRVPGRIGSDRARSTTSSRTSKCRTRLIGDIAAYCEQVGIEFMSTPFSVADAEAVDPNVRRHKVASYEINHVRLLSGWPRQASL